MRNKLIIVLALLGVLTITSCQSTSNNPTPIGDNTVYVNSINLSADEGTITETGFDMILEEGKTGSMTYTYTPTNPTSTSFTWKTSDTKVATVSKKSGTTSAVINAKGEGTADIYVTIKGKDNTTIESNRLKVKVNGIKRKTNDDFNKANLTYIDENKQEQDLNMSTLFNNSNDPHLNPLIEQHVLVVPFGFQDEDLQSIQTEENIDRITTTFFGSEEEVEEVGGWMSMSTFYKESSYGKSQFNGEVAQSWCVYEGTSKEFKDKYDSASLGVGAAEYARTWYMKEYSKENHGSLGEDAKPITYFDSDGDGYLDLVWIVYSHKTTTTGEWWAYVTYTNNTFSRSQPTVKTLGFASIDWMDKSCNGYDPHTYIHETGHTYGLADYYDYNNVWSPMGGIDFMDHNLGDHCMFSKFTLGWTSPWVVDDTAEITLRPGTTTGDCFIIPSPNYNGTAFDEYFMVELMAPVGLAEKDYLNGYENITGYSKPGIRITHVDARVQSGKHNEWYKTTDDVGQKATTFRLDNSYGGRDYNSSATDYYTIDKTTKNYMCLISLMESSIQDDNWTCSSSYNASNSTLFGKGEFFNLNSTMGWAKTYMPSGSNLWNKANTKTATGKEIIDESCTFNYSLTVKDIKEDEEYGYIATVVVNANAY